MSPGELSIIPIVIVKSSDNLAAAGDGTTVTITCSICLDDMHSGEQARDLPCGHMFHSACVDSWFLSKQRKCPICRQDVTQPTLISSKPKKLVIDTTSSEAASIHEQVSPAHEPLLG